MSKSILQNKKECYLCRKKYDLVGYDGELPDKGLHKHHIVFGTANRKNSEKYGLWVWVCEKEHHEHGCEAPHQNRAVAELLIRDGQREFEKRYSKQEWIKIFGKDWL